MHARVIITEAGAVVTATHLIAGQKESAVIHTAKEYMRAIIEEVFKDDRCQALSEDELDHAVEQGHYWLSLPHEECTVMIVEPEQIVQV